MTILKVDVRTGASKALAQLLEPLTEFAFDSGLSVREFHEILRAVAVRNVAARQLESSRRVNISGISASTGMSRAEVSRILKSEPKSAVNTSDKYQQSTTKILSTWQKDPKFTNPNGQPADLKIYGRGATFESLVKLYGKGLPIRAMLDELIRTQAIEVMPIQTVRLKTKVTVEKGMTPQVVKAFGDRVSELIETLLRNMRDPANSAFVATVAKVKVAPTEIPLLHREISSKGAEFLSEVQDILARGPINSRVSQLKKSPAITVTVSYHEDTAKAIGLKPATIRRRNFRRN